MTDKEIKQRAEEYAEQHKMRTDYGYGWEETYDTKQQAEAYIAGAHSRDEEIEHLARIATTYKVDAQDTVAECERLHDIIDQLRNPWISVKDRLPENNGAKIVLFDGMSKDGSTGKCVTTACYIGKGRWKSTFSLGTDAFNVQFSHTTGFITHWMEVPTVPRKEE